MKCAQCGWENPQGARFCGQCGMALQRPPAERSGRRGLIGLGGVLLGEFLAFGVGMMLGLILTRAPSGSQPLHVPSLGPATSGVASHAWPSPTVYPSPRPSPTPMKVFTDPWAYCAALGSGMADARYEGPSHPEPIARALEAMGVLAPGETFAWRCKNGRVYACSYGATLPCWPIDTQREPHPELIKYCRENPWASFIPMAVTGHSTLYTWACRNGQPVITGELWELDEEGYARELWYEIPPPPSSGR